jgi:hypothetical protein
MRGQVLGVAADVLGVIRAVREENRISVSSSEFYGTVQVPPTPVRETRM